MRQYQRLLIAVLLFISAWFCLLSAGIGMPENPSDLSDTRGLPAVMIYTVALQAIGLLAIIFTGVGMLVSAKLKSKSHGVRLLVFCSSNLLLLLAAFAGIFVISSYVAETLSGISGISLYIATIAVVTTAVPKRS
ncbi:hypothetical protein [Pseudomonas sp. fls2-241-R2A-110]|jgi:hypothetical protein|uniref:hypothetical protein n=1 Tax=Pseudomonas sp. fls2-241-R2A-110 TaxID=3040311 RepID=UPI00255391BB|nr:hypothetical protein [Pseudomonas sp. fls2-241-R2A-110]